MNENKNNISITNIRTKLKKKIIHKNILENNTIFNLQRLAPIYLFVCFFTTATECCVCVDLRQIKMIFLYE